MLFSGARQSDSAMYIHGFFFRFFSITVYYKIVNAVPFVTQYDFVYLVFYCFCNKLPHI